VYPGEMELGVANWNTTASGITFKGGLKIRFGVS
jgi:hypothetical protein